MAKTIILEKVKSTEKIVRQIESEIKKEIETLFNVKVDKVRTHILNNKKIAYVKLNKKFPAADLATKLGFM
jgi:ribosomal protein L23